MKALTIQSRNSIIAAAIGAVMGFIGFSPLGVDMAFNSIPVSILWMPAIVVIFLTINTIGNLALVLAVLVNALVYWLAYLVIRVLVRFFSKDSH